MKATSAQQPVGVPEVFVDLVLGDDDLMRAEFDALIAACWESPCEPPRRRPCPPAGAYADRSSARSPRGRGLPLAPAPRRRPESRQRGPPER